MESVGVLRLAHGDTSALKDRQFRTLKKCQGKFDVICQKRVQVFQTPRNRFYCFEVFGNPDETRCTNF